MDFLKKQYEKILLSAVLLALAVGAFLLTLHVESVKANIAEQGKVRSNRTKAALVPIDLSTNQEALQRLSKPIALNFAGSPSSGHNLVNPLRWIKDRSGQIVLERPGVGRGPSGLSLTRTIPLPLLVSYEGTAGSGDDLRYLFRIEKQYARKADTRRATVVSVTLNNKTPDSLFSLREVRGSKEAPTEVVIEMLDGGERLTLSREKRFSRTMGYMADLRQDFDNKSFSGKRLDETVPIGGKNYKVVAIGKDEVVVSDPESQKRTVIRAASTP